MDEREFTRRKLQLLDTIIQDAELSMTARVVAHRLFTYVNREIGYAWPAAERLGADVGLKEQAVRRALGELKGRYFEIKRRPNQAPRYTPIWNLDRSKMTGPETVGPVKNDPATVESDRSGLIKDDRLTPLQNTSIERDAADGASILQQDEEAEQIAAELRTVAGYTAADVPTGWSTATIRVRAWLAAGYRREVIVSTASSMARKSASPINSVQYFEKAIAEAHARLDRPVPQASNGLPPPPASVVNHLGRLGELILAKLEVHHGKDGPGHFKSWFLDVEVIGAGQLSVSSDMRKSIFEKRYADLVLAAWRQIDPSIAHVLIVARQPVAAAGAR